MGPKSVYSCGLEDKQAIKIAVKSHITFSMHDSGTTQTSGDAVVPIQELDMTAFVYLFKALGHPATLSYIVDSSIQASLYKNVHMLKVQAERIVEQVMIDLEKFEGKKLSKETQNLLKDWSSDLPDFVEMTVEEEVLTKKITIKKSETEGSFSFLTKILKGDFEKIITQVIRGETVYVAGDRPMCELAIATLEAFCPQIPKKITYTDSYIPSGKADLIGIPVSFMKVYIGSNVVNLQTGKVGGGQKNPFSKKLLDIAKKHSQRDAEEFIRKEIGFLVSKANELVETCMLGTPSDDDLSKFRKDVGGDKFTLIIDIAGNLNPKVKDLLPKDAGERFADFLTNL